jgi:dCTP deaminase
VGVFSDLEIKAGVKSGQIVLDPYIEEHIESSSVDVMLGEQFYSCYSEETDYFNPYDEQSVREYFKGPIRAERHDEWCHRKGRYLFRGIDPGDRIIVLRPRERILGHTIEFVGIRFGGFFKEAIEPIEVSLNGTSKMQARSTVGRLGIVVCKDAGWGDPGYINRWTMEIQNDNNVNVPLVVGTRLAQVVFYHMEPSEKGYAGSYQQTTDAAELRANWSPTAMLPKPLKRCRHLDATGVA